MLTLQPHAIARLVRSFNQVNARVGQTTPTINEAMVFKALAISKGMMVLHTVDDRKLEVVVSLDERQDDETYQDLVPLLAQQMAQQLGLHNLQSQVDASLRQEGLAIDFSVTPWVVRPLTSGVGETDQF